MLDKKNKTHFDLRGKRRNLYIAKWILTYTPSAGALVYDPCIGSFDYVQNEVPAVPFALKVNVYVPFKSIAVPLPKRAGRVASKNQFICAVDVVGAYS